MQMFLRRRVGQHIQQNFISLSKAINLPFSFKIKEIQRMNGSVFYDIGNGTNLKIKCISETGWKDSQLFLREQTDEQGRKRNQYSVKWNADNGLGSCSLITHTESNGKSRNFLIDSGWNHSYIKQRFKEEKIDQMLLNKQIDFVYLTHEHMDHFWGIGVILELDPEIPIILPETFSQKAVDLLNAKITETTKPYVTVKHRGPLIFTKLNRVYKIYDGCATVLFSAQANMGIKGEQSLVFNIRDKGYITATGCCHQGVIDLLDFIQTNFQDAKKNMYGLYGGLHIAPYNIIDNKGKLAIQKLGQYNLKKIACNHCTGVEAVQEMIKSGYPIVSGTGQHGSKTDLYVGNGDKIEF